MQLLWRVPLMCIWTNLEGYATLIFLIFLHYFFPRFSGASTLYWWRFDSWRYNINLIFYHPLFLFLKIINKNCTTHIPKNWHHNFASRWSCPLFRLFFRLECKMTYPCFFHGYGKNSALLLRNIVKYSIEKSSGRCFCSILWKRGTHPAHSFLML